MVRVRGYGQANRSEDDRHWKNNLMLTVPKRRGHVTPQGAKESTRVRRAGEQLAKSFYGGLHRKEQAKQGKQG